jgi:AraC-like DNA-binding protein
MLTLPRRAPDTGHSGHTVANMTRAGRERHPALAGKVSSAMPYDDTYPEGSVHVGLPSTSITMIVAFDDALDVGWLRSPEHATYWTSASGLHTEPAVIRTHGHQHGIQLELTPVGARALLGLHAGELAATTTDTERLPLGLTGSEHAWIAEGASDGVRLHRLEQALASRLGHRCGEAPDEVTEAWRVLGATGGRARIDDVARHVGWSRRTLLRRFTEELGVSPKRAARLFRFERARRLLMSGHSLAGTASYAGYADQAHLGREWRALTSQTPTETIHGPVAFVQDDPWSDGRGSSS